MRTISELSAENAEIADWVAERSRFELSGDFEEFSIPHPIDAKGRPGDDYLSAVNRSSVCCTRRGAGHMKSSIPKGDQKALSAALDALSLLGRIRQEAPNTAVLMVSGSNSIRRPGEVHGKQEQWLVSKPFVDFEKLLIDSADFFQRLNTEIASVLRRRLA